MVLILHTAAGRKERHRCTNDEHHACARKAHSDLLAHDSNNAHGTRTNINNSRAGIRKDCGACNTTAHDRSDASLPIPYLSSTSERLLCASALAGGAWICGLPRRCTDICRSQLFPLEGCQSDSTTI